MGSRQGDRLVYSPPTPPAIVGHAIGAENSQSTSTFDSDGGGYPDEYSSA